VHGWFHQEARVKWFDTRIEAHESPLKAPGSAVKHVKTPLNPKINALTPF
jgi:hypothetical protein